MTEQFDKSDPGTVAINPCTLSEAKCPSHSDTAPGLDGSDGKMNSLHWFPFYPNRWLGSLSVKCMSIEERGAYLELLSWQWQGQGWLPADKVTLSKVVGFDVSKYSAVLDKFPVLGAKRRNIVLLKIWEEQQSKHDRRSSSGKKRWENTDKEKETDKEANAPALHTALHTALHKQCTLTDDAFWETLKEKFAWCNVDAEKAKMEAWFLTAKGKRRNMTRKFVVNWLSRIDAPLKTDKPKDYGYDN